jgi:threonine dehydratase
MAAVTLEAIREAAAALAGQIDRTPTVHSRTLSAIAGAEVFLKLENLQFTGSFKERGAVVKLASLGPEARRRGVVAMSAGNHAQAVARHAQRLGIAATIVMPRYTPNVKVERTRGFGAEVVLDGDDLEAAGARAHALEAERGLAFVHPYDDPDVVRGQGTVALEMLEAQPDLDVLLVPVGGGGLVSGIAVAAKALRPGIEVVGVEAERFPSMQQALRGEPIRCGRTTLAEGIAVKRPGDLTLALVRAHVDDIVLVSEAAIEEALLLLLEVEKTVAEGAGATPLAALLEAPARFRGRRVGLVVSGGNIDLFPLAHVLMRGLVRTGRLVRVSVEILDVPGVLADVTRILADAGANVVEVHHRREFADVPVKGAEIDFVLQTRGREHAAEILARLKSAGYAAAVLENG